MLPGRRVIEGVVTRVASYETAYGVHWKMLVRVDEEGGTWTCAVSVPKSLLSQLPGLEGSRVRMKVTLPGTTGAYAAAERPTNAEVLR